MTFNAQLRRQLDFLSRSCVAFDQGFTNESIRIAAVIRILLHQTANSTSLLHHLNAADVELSSSVSLLLPGLPEPIMMLKMGILQSTTNHSEFVPNLDLNFLRRRYPAPVWWNQVVYIAGPIRATRKSMVLAAANKDGGAHVDQKLTPEYEALQTGNYGFHIRSGPIIDSHFVYLRQMGFELLNSPALLELAAGR